MTDAERLARHEAAHAAAAVLLCVPVRLVGLNADGGYCTHDEYADTPEGAARRIIIVLAALIESAESGDELPEWPIDPDAGEPGLRDDRTVLATLAHNYAITETHYRSLLITALDLTSSDSFRHLVTGISGLLDYRPVIDASLIAVIDRRI